MTLETKAAFARRLGVNKSTITRAAQAGRLVFEGKLVQVEQSLAKWQASMGSRPDVAARFALQRVLGGARHPTYQSGAENALADVLAGSAAIVAPGLPAQPPQLEGIEGEAGESHGRAHYKALALGYENQSIKLEIALRRHQRYPLPAVKREAHALGTTLRASVERLIDQTAPRLAAERDPAIRLELLQSQCAALRGAMRQEFGRALRRLREQEVSA